MPADTVADQLASLRRNHAEMTRLDAEIVEIDATLAAAGDRLAALNERLAILQRGGADPITHDEGLIAAIAADPTHAPDPEAVAAAIEKQRAARHGRDRRDAESSIIRDAIGAVEREIEASGTRRRDAAAARHGAWRQIIKGGRVYLLDAFEKAFEDLAVTYLAPLHALAEVRDPDTDELIDRNFYPRLSHDTLVKVERWGDQKLAAKMHFPYHGFVKATLPPAPLDVFFDAIKAAEAVADEA